MKIKGFNNFDKLDENEQGGGNKFILVRFGNSPDRNVSAYFNEIAIKNPKPFLMKGPGSFITMFSTAETKESLIAGFDRLGASYNLYQIVHTSTGSAGPHLVARKKNVDQLKAELKKAVDAEDWTEAARLRDEIAEREGTLAPGNAHESKLESFKYFMFLKEEEEYVNGVNQEEFYSYVSKLVDHEIEELKTETEHGISSELCQKIKDYLVQNNLYVRDPEAEDKTPGEANEAEN